MSDGSHEDGPHEDGPHEDGRRAAGAAGAETARHVRETVAILLDLDEDSLSLAEPLDAVEGWDSVNALRVLMVLEREAGHPLDFDAFSAAGSLGEIADLLAATVAAAGASR